MRKEQLVKLLAPLWRQTNPLSEPEAVAHLFGWSVQQLEQYYNAQVKLGNVKPPPSKDEMVRALIDPWRRNDAVQIEAIPLSKLEEETIYATASLSADREIRRLRETEAEQQRKREGREIFSQYARQSGVADIQANFELVWRALADESFDKHGIEKAVRDGLQLAPASVEEISRRTVEAIQNHQDWMKNRATPAELREQVTLQSDYAREKAQQAFLDQQLAIRTEREAYMGFPPLPAGITKEQIFKMSGEEMRKLVKRHGFAMVERRLQGKG